MALTPPFATPAQLASRWRPLSTDEEARATVLLSDASDQILAEDRHGTLDGLDSPTPILEQVACAMVQRAMESGPGAPAGVTQQATTVGPFSAQYTYANPTADLYLTKRDRRLLRFNRQRAASVDMWAGAYEGA
ncbi:hypothetical protein GCM10025865_01180 [Paraoerskovia sediminicola]|uniref:Phage protein Gp19/Gp15/Gp42 n=1 Tax=Paraoerskovia sediminicola TaxID=1138587 RepID=A0ABN6X7Z4_9CELL|nr:Gp19/Gp15/Gp42 family protein [Paraoerskovia sediminicola]BDZ40819.1 hypothetical protein GCM10025865_01180 [Paraoerskovia sediminicola]